MLLKYTVGQQISLVDYILLPGPSLILKPILPNITRSEQLRMCMLRQREIPHISLLYPMLLWLAHILETLNTRLHKFKCSGKRKERKIHDHSPIFKLHKKTLISTQVSISISHKTYHKVEKLEKNLWRYNLTLFTRRLVEAFMKSPLKCSNIPPNNLNSPWGKSKFSHCAFKCWGPACLSSLTVALFP